MFKRIKNLWNISQLHADPNLINEATTKTEQTTTIGDGKAVFLGEGSQEEYDDFLKEENGTKPWYDRLKNMI